MYHRYARALQCRRPETSGFDIKRWLYFRIPRVMQQRNKHVVENIISTLLEILFAFQL